MFKGLLMISMSMGLLASCAQWPEKGRGGDADRYAAQHYYEPAATLEDTAAYLQSQLEIQQAQLDVLSLQGAKVCLPASVRRLALLSNRTRREIEAGLYLDAGHDLVVLQRELRFLRQQFLTVSQQTTCHLNQPAQQVAPVALLNVFFDVDDAVLSSEFIEQIRWWRVQAAVESQWWVRGYTDYDGAEDHNIQLAERRVQSVVHELINLGVAKSQIEIEILGEDAPFLSGNDAFSKGMNRRVDIYLKPDASKAEGVPVQQWDALGIKQPRLFEYDWQ